MTTPRPILFPATTPRAGVLVLFVIISDSNDEITTLPVRPAPPSSDRIPDLSGFPLDSDDDSSNEDLRKEISMPLGYIAVMDRWKAAPPSTGHPLLPSEIPSSSSPPSLLSSSSSPPPSLSPSSSLGDDIETLHASLESAMQETMTLRAKVRLLKQHNVVTQELLRIARGMITWSQLRAEYAEQKVKQLREFRVIDKLEILELRSQTECAESRHEQSHDRQTGDGAYRTDITEQDIETLRGRAEAVEQRAETLHVSVEAARMDIKDLIESCEADRFEMVELRSRAHDIDASF
ncbi:hypothetical protein Tco_0582048 [Tanacetum coccineum]